MKIKTETFLRAIKGDKARLTTCLVLIIVTMFIVFVAAIRSIEAEHRKELEKTRKQTEQQIYNFLTR